LSALTLCWAIGFAGLLRKPGQGLAHQGGFAHLARSGHHLKKAARLLQAGAKTG
jgi:hypothetical protein